MNLDQQLDILINEAPNYGVPSLIMEYGVVPVLKTYAQQLDYQQYYLRQTLERNLVITILSDKNNPNLEKRVIYAFPTVNDAAQFPDIKINDANIVAEQVSVCQILFQMFTMKEIDSIIFIDKPENYQKSKEIYCHKLQDAIQENLKLLIKPNSPTNNIA
jgi:hypothetical protein